MKEAENEQPPELQSSFKVETRQVNDLTQIVIQEVDEEDRPNSASSKGGHAGKDKSD